MCIVSTLNQCSNFQYRLSIERRSVFSAHFATTKLKATDWRHYQSMPNVFPWQKKKQNRLLDRYSPKKVEAELLEYCYKDEMYARCFFQSMIIQTKPLHFSGANDAIQATEKANDQSCNATAMGFSFFDGFGGSFVATMTQSLKKNIQ